MKRKHMKKALSLAMSLALILSVLPGFAVAADEPVKTGYFGDVVDFPNPDYQTVFTNYITRVDAKLMDGDEELRFVGFNSPNYAFLEDPDWHTITNFEMEDMLKTVKQCNANVVRVYSMGFQILEGYTANRPWTEWNVSIDDAVKHIGFDPEMERRPLPAGVSYPSGTKGDFYLNETVFERVDYLLAMANKYGVRVIFPFMNQWDWFGGRGAFANYWGQASSALFNPFLTAKYNQVVEEVLERTNTYTGVKYKDDPAILCWETSNEFNNSTAAWVGDLGKFMHVDLEMKQLLMDGDYRQGNNAARFRDSASNTGSARYIDILNDHYYLSGTSPDFSACIAPYAAIAQENQKPWIIGEFGCTNASMITRLLDAVVDYDVSGILIWSLRYRNEEGGFYWHREGESATASLNYYSYHWPGFEENGHYQEKLVVDTLYEYAYKINGEKAPVKPAPWPGDAPQLKDIRTPASINWRGVTGASHYNVERATSADGPWTVVGSDLTDGMQISNAGPLFSDMTTAAGRNYYYRVIGYNESGYTEYSNVAGPVAGGTDGYDANLLADKNYSFENADIAPWTFKNTGSGASAGSVAIDTANAVSGGQSAKITNNGELAITFDVTPQATYTVSYWLKTNVTTVKQTVLSRTYLGNAAGDPWWDYRGPGGVAGTSSGGPAFNSNYGKRMQLGAVDKELSNAMDGRATINDNQWRRYTQVITGGDLDIAAGVTQATLIIATPNSSVTYVDDVCVYRNIVANAGFQNRGSRWQTEGGWNAMDPNGGSNIMGYINATGSGARLSQRLYVAPDTEYVLTFRSNTAANGATYYIADEDYNPITPLYRVPVRAGASLWDVVSMSFDSGNHSAVRIVVKDAGGSGVVQVDDFSLVTAASYMAAPGEPFAAPAVFSPSVPGAGVIEDGESYGGSDALLNDAWTVSGASLSLDYAVYDKGSYGVSVQRNGSDFPVLTKTFETPIDLSDGDGVGFWFDAPENAGVTVTLTDVNGQLLRMLGVSKGGPVSLYTDFADNSAFDPAAVESASIKVSGLYAVFDSFAAISSPSAVVTGSSGWAIAATVGGTRQPSATISAAANGNLTRITYNYNTGNVGSTSRKSFSEIQKTANSNSLAGCESVSFPLLPANTGDRMMVRLYLSDLSFADAPVILTGTERTDITIPLSAFTHYATNRPLSADCGLTVETVGLVFGDYRGNPKEGSSNVSGSVSIGDIRLNRPATDFHIPVEKITLKGVSVTVKKGQTITLNPEIAPANATDQSLTWYSSDTNIATVTTAGVVKGIKSGMVVVTCVSNDRTNVFAYMVVNVIP